MTEIYRKVTDLRHELHQYPEVSGKESETASRIKLFISQYQPDELIEEVGGHGLLAIYKGDKEGKTILIRCELDALPITEINLIPYSSRNVGKGHMCGHDGHMSIVSGIAALLSEKKPVKGKVILLFQPSEEDGRGAQAVINDARFKSLNPDLVFALHNLPGYKEHQIILKKGSFTAAVNSIIIKLTGRTSHAGEPEKGKNPALALAEIIHKVNELNNADRSSDEFRQITYVHSSMGEKAYGTSAGEAELGLTFRCWSTGERDKLGKQIEKVASRAAKRHKLALAISYTESFASNMNDSEAVDIIEEAAKKLKLKVKRIDVPNRFGEDFGLFTELYPGALFGIGAGKKVPALHNPDYDFPDEIIETGINMFNEIIRKITDE